MFTQRNISSECHWSTYALDIGKDGNWIKRGIFPECSGYQISRFLYRFSNYVYEYAQCFQLSTGKVMVLNGIIYIFVEPNNDSILGFSLANQQIFQPMNTYYYPYEMNVKELKTIVPFYT